MYLGSWKIDDYLTFPCNTHRADTGAATDGDAVPAYRIYEDETATPIVTGNMAKLDDANTTGFYSERVQLTAAQGFEKGKTYTIYISVAVNSVTGTMSHTFQIEAEVDANVVSDKTGYELADDAITSGKFDESTAFPVKSADTGATQIARVGADSDTLETLSDQIDAIPTVTEIQAEMEENGASILDTLNDDLADGGRLDLLIDAIKSKTDGLNFSGNNVQSRVADKGVLNNPPSENADDYKADVSGLATAAALSTHDTDIKGVIATAQADLDNPGQYKADVSGLATAAALSTHDSKLDSVKAETDKLNNMIEADGEDWQYTQNALEQAPGGGGGGDATAENQQTIITHLTDIKGTGFVKDTDSLVDIGHIGADGDTLETLSDQMDDIGNQAGAGAIEVVYTLTKEGTEDPIADADVWVTSDEAGNNVIASGKTDQYGTVTFYLDEGTVYIWRQKSGYNFDNPDTEVVSS